MKPFSLITAFWAAADNCVAVAFIKAMLAGRRLYTIKVQDRKIYLSLKDGMIFTFTPQQLRSINKGNGIRYRKSATKKLRQHVETLFALLIVQMQLQGYHGRELTRSRARQLLVKGIETRNIHRWLGVQQIRGHFTSSKKNLSSILLFNDKHISFASNNYFDKEGTAVSQINADKSFLFGPPTYYYKLY